MKAVTNTFLALTVAFIYEHLSKDGMLVIKGLGTFYKIPARKGKVYNGFTGEKVNTRYEYRIKFVPNETFKNIICK
jgi:nucleoid DNA-binding protein